MNRYKKISLLYFFQGILFLFTPPIIELFGEWISYRSHYIYFDSAAVFYFLGGFLAVYTLGKAVKAFILKEEG